MSAIWHNNGTGWSLLGPVGFPDEAALHALIAEAPQLLPLAGTPDLTVVGKEVQLGTGYADLIAVEPSGRLVIIEIKLARNAEARRAVVAQVLAYAAYLHGLDRETLETSVLGAHLAQRGYSSLGDAISTNDQAGSFDSTTFSQGLAECLQEGRFRLVLVLDDVREELVRLVRYLETVTDRLLIDLVTVSSYDVAGSQVIVPQRVDPERHQTVTVPPRAISIPSENEFRGRLVEGADDFVASIDTAPDQYRGLLRRLCDWAKSLESDGLAYLSTFHGKSGRLTLLPRLKTARVGLVSISDDGGACLWFWRSVFERLAPTNLPQVETLLSPTKLGQGTTLRNINDELLQAHTGAYREAASRQV